MDKTKQDKSIISYQCIEPIRLSELSSHRLKQSELDTK